MSTLFDSIPAANPPMAAGPEAAAPPVLRSPVAASSALEAHCRRCFPSWDGYRGLGGVMRQHFTEEMREHFRSLYRHLFEEPTQ